MNEHTRASLSARIAAALIFAVLLFLNPQAYAEDAATARGFRSDALYDFSNVDSINRMNGNLIVPIALGQRFTTTGSLSYQFKLVYNSNIWDWAFYNSIVPNNFEFERWFFGQHYKAKWIDPEELSPGEFVGAESFPSRKFNAGLGWTFSLGELHETIGNARVSTEYVSEDGATHPFYQVMHGDLPQTFVLPADKMLYTRDGSYIRLHVQSADVREVHLPDGTRKRFRKVDWPSDSRLPHRWLLEQIADPFGNVLHVERSPAARPAAGLTWTWTYIEGNIGADRYANMPADAAMFREVRRHVAKYDVRPDHLRVKELVLPATGNQTATYTLAYENAQTYRSFDSTWYAPVYTPWTVLPNAPKDTQKIAVSLLTSVTLPDTGGVWTFEYNHQNPGDLQSSIDNKYYVTHVGGRLVKAKLPTGGAIAYQYAPFAIAMLKCGLPVLANLETFSAVGVKSRQVLNRDGSADGAPWQYYRNAFFGTDPGSNCSQPKEMVSLTVDPLSNVDVAFFSVYAGAVYPDANTPWQANEWGMPWTKAEHDGAGRYLSSQTYDCPATAFPSSNDANGWNAQVRQLLARYRVAGAPLCGDPVRSTFVKYEMSAKDCEPGGLETSCTQANSRLSSERVIYHDDPKAGASLSSCLSTAGGVIGSGCWASRVADYTSFDGHGHYRKSTTSSSNFSYAINRSVTQNWNPGRSSTNIIPASQPWISTYDSILEEEGTAKAETLFDFDGSNGWLKAKRRLKSGRTLNGHDLLEFYDRARVGTDDVTIDTHSYGGDLVAISALPAETFTRPDAPPGYRSRATLRYGGVAEKSAINRASRADAPTYLVLETNVVDKSTALVTSSDDTSGFTTSYQYDLLGRLKKTSSPEAGNGGSTQLEYIAATNAVDASVTVKQLSGTTQVGFTEYRYDGFGRSRQTRTLMPGGTYSIVTTEYLPTGWVSRKSTASDKEASSAAGWMEYNDYDPFGRPRVLKNPHGKKTLFEYKGEQKIITTVEGVSTGPGSTTDSKSWQFKDAGGRLRAVTDYSDPAAVDLNDNTVRTIYEYDVQSRLSQVNMGGQIRTFNYDNRGFLTSETHPEAGATPIRYTYDSRGYLRTRKHAATGNTRFDLTYQYDPAARMTNVSVWDAQTQATVPFKTFQYHELSGLDACANDWGFAKGKLRLATRHNRIPNPTAIDRTITLSATEFFFYKGKGGRLSSIETQLASRPSFTTSFQYDDIGNLIQTGYPVQDGGTIATAAPVRNLAYGYTNGRLTSVTGFAPSITYHSNGLISRLQHSNGVTDVMLNDRKGMARPRAMYTEGVANGMNWNPAGTAEITYDGAGSVAAIGADADWFAYDRVGRLVEARVGSAGGEGSGITQSYQYDRWGNLVHIGDRPIGVDSNNRLTGAEFDEAGNVKKRGAFTYESDAANMMRHLSSDGAGRIYVYAANDERIGVIDYKYRAVPTEAPRVRELWTIRDPGGRSLREMELLGGAWRWQKDYVYAGTALIASEAPGGVRMHFTRDHLGSTRLITRDNATRASYRSYLPFGEELTASTDGERMKFAGHERDEINPVAGTQLGDMDYMHARYYVPGIGRFLSVDPAQRREALANPQLFNRYAYALNNPVSAIDPDGREVFFVVTNQVDGSSTVNRRPGNPARGQVTERAPLYKMIMTNVSGSVRTTAVTRDTNYAGPISQTRGSYGTDHETPPGRYHGTIRTDGNKGFRIELSDTPNGFTITLPDGTVRENLQIHLGAGCSQGCLLLTGGRIGRAAFEADVNALIDEDVANGYSDDLFVVVQPRNAAEGSSDVDDTNQPIQ